MLVALAGDPSLRVRDLAFLVGITERAVAQILNDLEAEGYLEKERVGRRNVYVVNSDVPLRHALEMHRTVSDIVRLARRRSK
ncbi:MAG: helix-turn-helix transcriptional regulator [Vulcanimicrobiaceae bacterium]